MPSETAAPPGATGDVLEALQDTRDRTLALVAHLDDDALERVHSPLMSPLVWDLGHIAAFEDLWLARRGAGLELLRADLAEVYDAFETPRAQRGELPYLRRDEAIAYLADVRERALQAGTRDPLLLELVLRHEQQHTETMLQTMELARLPAPHAPLDAPATADPALAGLSGLELVEVPAGPCTLGAGADGFAYDNERPRHARELPAFRIGRAPVTNEAFMAFVAGGGYERPEWWSREAWAWKEQYDIERPAGWTTDGREWRMDRCVPLDPRKPVVHVSWFEADAFARAHGARLPTEAEWEKAATWDQGTQAARPQPWGAEPASDAIASHANVDQRAFGTVPVGSHPGGASPAGCLGMIGDVWEWTASRFDGYPGFAAHPYREYSEVFFGGDYRVLRGGSWATRARVATPTFRNWDHPQRRQIFAGLRIAKDA
ncbi:MAG: ergothioneine biosynthesis protein EgtB [Actinobacteria bacterium]|nr:ergothioneine biosynthesis protein EgtB [Actinomycetota bacterium]